MGWGDGKKKRKNERQNLNTLDKGPTKVDYQSPHILNEDPKYYSEGATDAIHRWLPSLLVSLFIQKLLVFSTIHMITFIVSIIIVKIIISIFNIKIACCLLLSPIAYCISSASHLQARMRSGVAEVDPLLDPWYEAHPGAVARRCARPNEQSQS